MRTSEERVRELHHRMRDMEKTRNRRRYRMACAAACTACLAITVLMALVISRIPVHTTDAVAGGITASIFTDHASLGYVLVAAVALCLGVLVTVFCFRLKRHMDDKEKSDDRKH